jgi:hypothetical protein
MRRSGACALEGGWRVFDHGLNVKEASEDEKTQIDDESEQ